MPLLITIGLHQIDHTQNAIRTTARATSRYDGLCISGKSLVVGNACLRLQAPWMSLTCKDNEKELAGAAASRKCANGSSRVDADTAIGGHDDRFPSTQLSLLEATASGLSSEALERVITIYWKPGYGSIPLRFTRTKKTT